jgi:hypothetical protein
MLGAPSSEWGGECVRGARSMWSARYAGREFGQLIMSCEVTALQPLQRSHTAAGRRAAAVNALHLYVCSRFAAETPGRGVAAANQLQLYFAATTAVGRSYCSGLAAETREEESRCSESVGNYFAATTAVGRSYCSGLAAGRLKELIRCSYSAFGAESTSTARCTVCDEAEISAMLSMEQVPCREVLHGTPCRGAAAMN